MQKRESFFWMTLKELLEICRKRSSIQQLSSDKPVVSVVEDEKKEVEKEKE